MNLHLLHLDVECTPNLATVWGIWNQNIGLSQLHETSRIMCFTAKWHGSKDIIFFSERMKGGHKKMMALLHDLMCEADALCHYNGNRFDIPVINREFLKYGWAPPAPSSSIDLLKVVKKNFRFVSNKLDHIAKELGIGQKLDTGGHQLWLDCMAGDEKAWQKMEKYNKHDVILLEKLYSKLLPWITNHPHQGLYVDDEIPCCRNCGGHKLQKRGTAVTAVGAYQRYQCSSCGTWGRGKKNMKSVEVR